MAAQHNFCRLVCVRACVGFVPRREHAMQRVLQMSEPRAHDNERMRDLHERNLIMPIIIKRCVPHRGDERATARVTRPPK